ncbi:restriction endonuclease subunit S [Paenibacillus lautus]|uniref:restriction endonuclease subunit S n=1 Tax=Paenibacillus lautus TaxID=1401 RepID=UPI00384F9722
MSQDKNIGEIAREIIVPEDEQPYEVPDNWVWVRFGKVIEINPKKPKLTYSDETLCSFLPMNMVNPETGKIYGLEERAFCKVNTGYSYFEENDVLFAKITPCMENGNSVIAKGLKNNFGFGSTEFFVLRTSEYIAESFVHHLVRSERFRKQAKQVMTGAVGQQRVPKKFIEDYPLALPPIDEQRRISDKVERLLNKIDEAKKLIEEAKETFKLRRAAILDKAFCGELTRKWREENPKSTFPLKNVKKVHENILFPNNWVVSDFQSVAADKKYSLAIGPFGSNLKVTDYTEDGVPLVFVRNIRSSNFNLEPKYISVEKANKLAAHTVHAGDVLITKMGDPPGDSTICPSNIEKAVITSDCIKLTVNSEIMNNKFVMYAIRAPYIHKQILEQAKGVAQQKISLEIFKKMRIPVPSLEEQEEIVKQLEQYIESEIETMSNIESVLGTLLKLEQSILTNALQGKLGTNIRGEESVIELLREVVQEQGK